MLSADLPRVAADVERGLAAGRVATRYRICLPGRTVRHVRSYGTVVPGADGAPARVIGVVADEAGARGDLVWLAGRSAASSAIGQHGSRRRRKALRLSALLDRFLCGLVLKRLVGRQLHCLARRSNNGTGVFSAKTSSFVERIGSGLFSGTQGGNNDTAEPLR